MEFTTTAVRADNSYWMYRIGDTAIITEVEKLHAQRRTRYRLPAYT